MTFTFRRFIRFTSASCRGAYRLAVVPAAAGLLAATTALAGPGAQPVANVNTSAAAQSPAIDSAELPGNSLGDEALRAIAGKGDAANTLRPIDGVAVILWDEARTGRPKPSGSVSQSSNAQYASVPVVKVNVVQPK